MSNIIKYGVARALFVPAALITAIAVGTHITHNTKKEDPPTATSPDNGSNNKTNTKTLELNVTPQAIANSVAISTQESTPIEMGLTEEEKQAINYMEEFLTKYTGNGAYNYGSMTRFIEGLKLDYDAVYEEAKTREGTEKEALEAYPNNNFATKFLIQRGIAKRGKEQMSLFFKEIGVDENTINQPDESEIKNYVTKAELLEFGQHARALKSQRERKLPPGSTLAFKEGVSLSILEHIKSGKPGLPTSVEITKPNTEIVEENKN